MFTNQIPFRIDLEYCCCLKASEGFSLLGSRDGVGDILGVLGLYSAERREKKGYSVVNHGL